MIRDKCEARLLRRLEENLQTTVVVKLKKTPEQVRMLSMAPAQLRMSTGAAIDSLKKEASNSQGEIREFIDKEYRSFLGSLRALSMSPQREKPLVKPLWLVNAIGVRGTPELIAELAKRPDVEEIVENQIFSLPRRFKGEAQGETEMTWGLRRLGVEDLWAMGFKGGGIKVGHLDTGVDADHPDLKGKVAGWAEFDANGFEVPGSIPHDTDTHGTHTAGTIVGGATSGIAIGVAPEAMLYSGMVLNGGSGTLLQVIAGMEWALSQGVEVLSMSLGGDGITSVFDEAVRNLAAANVFQSYAIGNSGPMVTSAPGNVPEAYSVGAVDINDMIASFSGGGIIFRKQDRIQPDGCAPGVDILSAFPRANGSYARISGTSMATPHVSGVVALLKQAYPQRSAVEIEGALNATALDLGGTGDDYRYGLGLIQPKLAMALLNGGSSHV
jgi:subtilisin family serine protease